MSPRVVQRQCQLCEAHCGVRVHVEAEQVTRIEGDPDDVMSKGYICPKGTALADLHTDPERLRRPLKRVGDGFEEIDWDEAFQIAGRILRDTRADHGADAVAAYLGNPVVHGSSALALELFKRVLGSRNIYAASSVDQFPQYVAAIEMFGSHLLMPIADVERTDHLLIIGANPAVSNGSVTTMPDAKARLKAIIGRGGKVVVIDPRRTETARVASEHVAVRPGGDAQLLLGMLHVIFRDDLTRPAYPSQGLRALQDLAAEWTPQRAAEPAGVPAEDIERLAFEFATAPTACAYGRIGICHQETGTVTHWLINALNLVTGNLDKPGGAMFSTPPADLAQVLRLVWGHRALGKVRSRVSGYRDVHGELPVVALPEEITTPGEGQVRTLITFAGNPALSSPQSARMDEALAQLDHLICVDFYVTETSRHADLILPPTSHLERDDVDLVLSHFAVRNNLRFSSRVFDPAPDALSDWDIVMRLTAELPIGPGAAVLRRAMRAAGAVISDGMVSAALVAAGPHGPLRKGLRGVTLAAAKRTPGGLDLGPLTPRLRARIETPDKLVSAAPASLLGAAARLQDDAAGAEGEFDLQLIGRRHLRSNNSWLHNVETMVKGRDRCTALMHPSDAAAREVGEDDRVTVTSPVGSIEVPVEISDTIRPGVVAIPHGWGHDVKGVGWSTAAAHAGANVNLLTQASRVDELSGNAAVNATWVKVSRA